MAFGTQGTDASGVIYSSLYVPGVNNFPALRGTPLAITDSNSNLSAGVLSEMIFEAVLNGQAFSGTTGAVSNAGSSAVAGFSVFNTSSSGFNVLVYSLTFTDDQAGDTGCLLKAVTTNPSLATTITKTNRDLGSATTSQASVTFLNTGYTATGTTLDLFDIDTAKRTYTIIAKDDAILLPKGSNNGIVFVPTMVTAATHNFAITAKWIEF